MTLLSAIGSTLGKPEQFESEKFRLRVQRWLFIQLSTYEGSQHGYTDTALLAFLKGLGELESEFPMAYRGCGLFTALGEDQNHVVNSTTSTVLCKVYIHIFVYKSSQTGTSYSLLLSLNILRTLHVKILQRRKIQVCLVRKLTIIIFDSDHHVHN